MANDMPYGLTTAQHEALIVAVKHGYFDVPATSTLDALSEMLEITPQAVSERLNRGTKTLVETALLDVT